jgi:hypothetical protein
MHCPHHTVALHYATFQVVRLFSSLPIGSAHRALHSSTVGYISFRLLLISNQRRPSETCTDCAIHVPGKHHFINCCYSRAVLLYPAQPPSGSSNNHFPVIAILIIGLSLRAPDVMIFVDMTFDQHLQVIAPYRGLIWSRHIIKRLVLDPLSRQTNCSQSIKNARAFIRNCNSSVILLNHV